jgi:hypothetical protein
MHKSRYILRSSLWAVVAAAVLAALAAGPAAADTGKREQRPIVHQTPKVPLVVDGVRYAPQQIHRFDGRPLYMRVARNGKLLIAYTNLAAYKSDLRRRDLRLPTRARVRSGKAQAASLGHFIDLCTGATVDGFCTRLESGYGVANFAPVPAWIGYVPIRGLFVNNISSVRSVGQNSILFNNPDFDPSGGTLVIPPNVVRTLSDFGFDNVTESGFMFF